MAFTNRTPHSFSVVMSAFTIRTPTEIKFEVQNTAGGRKAAFILGFKGGDVGTLYSYLHLLLQCFM
jgi:hypothetical protein